METLITISAAKFFSLYGLVVVFLSLLPNFVYAKKTHQGKLDDVETCGVGICMLELVSRFALTLVLVLVRMPLLHYGFCIVAGVFLIINYMAWIRYYKKGAYYPDIYIEKFLGLPTPMDTCMVIYLVFASLWLGNIFALCLSLIYGVCHLANSQKAMRDLKCRI